MTFAARMTTAADILALFTEYSVECGDGVLAGGGATIDGIQQKVLDNLTALKHNVVQKNDRITFIELRKSTTGADQTAAQTAMIDEIAAARGGAITAEDFPEVARRKQQIDASFVRTNTIRGKSTLKSIAHAAPTPVAVPCYFLPWNPTGGAVELKISDRGGGPASNTNPILFLTAALSGCSVYVKGPAEKPTIFHCGTQHDTVGSQASVFWDSVMRQLGHEPENLAVVHNKDYTVPKRGGTAEMKAAVRRQDEARSALQAAFKSTLDVEEVSTWGSVFGIRDGRNWTFYMQENCTVTYHKIRKSKYLGRRISDGPPRVYSRPMYCRQIFPDGGGKAQCFQHLRQLKV